MGQRIHTWGFTTLVPAGQPVGGRVRHNPAVKALITGHDLHCGLSEGQRTHPSPGSGVYVPALHAVHELAPATEVWSEAHVVHELAPSAENVFGGQGQHGAPPIENVPLGHVAHLFP